MTREEIKEMGWTALLRRATDEPGLIADAYHAFHNYSIGNMILALIQCYTADMQPGPIATYKGWQEKGRQVRKGEKALVLWQPITGHRTETDEETGEEKRIQYVKFMLAARWFTLSQTDGPDIEYPPTGMWALPRALANLEIKQVAFDHPNGNAQGFARPGQIAVSPVAVRPLKTAVHEIAHIVLGHTKEETMIDDERLALSLIEVEAEATAMIVISALGLPGEEFSRGYIQSWWRCGEEIPEKSAQRIFSAANKILQAGKAEQAKAEEAEAELEAAA